MPRPRQADLFGLGDSGGYCDYCTTAHTAQETVADPGGPGAVLYSSASRAISPMPMPDFALERTSHPARTCWHAESPKLWMGLARLPVQRARLPYTSQTAGRRSRPRALCTPAPHHGKRAIPCSFACAPCGGQDVRSVSLQPARCGRAPSDQLAHAVFDARFPVLEHRMTLLCPRRCG